MKRSIFISLFLFCAALTNVGGCNLFSDMYNHNSDEAIAVDIQKLIDGRLWNDAVLKWATLSSTAQARRANQVLLATAYAGRGGLDMLNLVSKLSSPAGSLFPTLLQAFTGSTLNNFNDEVLSEAVLLNLSPTASGRSLDENIFMLFVEFAKLGTLMAATGDLDLNGTVDAGYDNCGLSALEGAHVITAIGNIMDILNTTGTTLGGGAMAGLATACGSLGGACAVTLVANVTALQNQIGRTLVGESNLGIGLAAPYNNPYCQLTLAPIDPTTAVPFNNSCPGGLAAGTGDICP